MVEKYQDRKYENKSEEHRIPKSSIIIETHTHYTYCLYQIKFCETTNEAS